MDKTLHLLEVTRIVRLDLLVERRISKIDISLGVDAPVVERVLLRGIPPGATDPYLMSNGARRPRMDGAVLAVRPQPDMFDYGNATHFTWEIVQRFRMLSEERKERMVDTPICPPNRDAEILLEVRRLAAAGEWAAAAVKASYLSGALQKVAIAELGMQ